MLSHYIPYNIIKNHFKFSFFKQNNPTPNQNRHFPKQTPLHILISVSRLI